MNAERPLPRRGADAVAQEVRAYGGSFAEHNVIAEYEDMASAKSAVDALQNAGVEAANVSLLGRRAERAKAVVSQSGVRRTDARMSQDIARRAIAGIVIGAVALGLPLGLVAYAIEPDLGFWVSVVGGVLLGGIVGGFSAGMWSLNASSETAETPYRDEGGAGSVFVGVSSDDEGGVERAQGILSKKSPRALHRFDRNGRPMGA